MIVKRNRMIKNLVINRAGLKNRMWLSWRLWASLLPIWSGAFNTNVLAAGQPLTVRPSLSVYTLGTVVEPVKDSSLNPKNKILRIPSAQASVDFRPNLKIDSGEVQLVARPQIEVSVAKAKVDGVESSEHPSSLGKWNEAYGQYTASERLLISYGVQSFQWGSAELLNPSNTIFHESADSKGILSPVVGRNIARINLTWLKNLSTILMTETEATKGASEFRAEEIFETRSLLKNEISWSDGSEFIGVVFGAAETGSPSVGEYFNIELFDGLSFYGDATHRKQSQAWYPVVEKSATDPNKNVVQLRQSRLHDQVTYSTAIGGLRYSFEGGSDLRLEYLAQNSGWTKEQNKNAMLALDTRNPLQLADYEHNLKRSLKPGLEYRGQRYAMVSLRWAEVASIKDFTIYGRALRSLSDFSSKYYETAEYGFGSSSTLILQCLTAIGAEDTDLRGVVATSVTAGLRQDF
jgi:hypothetical protein